MDILTAPLKATGNFNPSAAEGARLQSEFNLSYHIPYCAEADRRVGLAGKRVLEVGGSLPRGFVRDHLQAAHWTAVEELSYWRCVDRVEHLEGSPLQQKADAVLADATPEILTGDYTLIDGAIEDAPDALAEQFDVAFSIACFEHVSRLPKALERIHKLLKPGGKLFTMFSPVWSAHDGHHLPEITDASGRTFKFNDSPIPPWGHLLCGPSGMYSYLLQYTDAATAEQMVYYIYHAPHINRLFIEDYAAYFDLSPLKILTCEATFPTAVPADLQAQLERLHPGHSRFKNNGLLVVLEKSR